MKKEESEQKKQKFMQLRVMQGKSYDTISKELKISKQTCINWSVELKNEIKNIQSAKYDALIEELEISHFNRLKLLGSIYKKIEKEIQNRIFTEVPTDKLVKLLIELKTQINLMTYNFSFISEIHQEDDITRHFKSQEEKININTGL